jgi:hypothetical protein
MNVRLIPEDDQRDRFILKPILEAMLTHLGKPHARVEIARPRIRGWEAVKTRGPRTRDPDSRVD